MAKGVPQQSFNDIHRGELPLILSSGWTEESMNTVNMIYEIHIYIIILT